MNRLTAKDRKALRHIVNHADVLEVQGRYWILVQASPLLLEQLSEFEAEFEDCEDDLCDEPETDTEDERTAD